QRRRRQRHPRRHGRRGDPGGGRPGARRPAVSRAIAARRRAVAWVPATGGELLQGVDEQGPVLVSLPLRRGGTVTVRLLDGGLVSGVPERPRALAALGLALGHCGWTGGAEVLLGGEVPIGLGRGSSTIHVCGAIAATF